MFSLSLASSKEDRNSPIITIIGFRFFGLDPNSPAGNTLDINLSDPQFTDLIGSGGAFDRQIFSLR